MEADDLTNEVFDKFDLGRRINIVPEDIQWIVLPEIMEASRALYEAIVDERASLRGSKAPTKWRKMAAKDRMRNVNPW